MKRASPDSVRDGACDTGTSDVAGASGAEKATENSTVPSPPADLSGVDLSTVTAYPGAAYSAHMEAMAAAEAANVDKPYKPFKLPAVFETYSTSNFQALFNMVRTFLALHKLQTGDYLYGLDPITSTFHRKYHDSGLATTLASLLRLWPIVELALQIDQNGCQMDLYQLRAGRCLIEAYTKWEEKRARRAQPAAGAVSAE